MVGDRRTSLAEIAAATGCDGWSQRCRAIPSKYVGLLLLDDTENLALVPLTGLAQDYFVAEFLRMLEWGEEYCRDDRRDRG